MRGAGVHPGRETGDEGLSTPSIVRQLCPLLHEDDDILVVGKPPGIDLERTRAGEPASLLEVLALVRGSSEKCHIVHRLGRNESGVVVLGKSRNVADQLRKGFRTHQMGLEFAAVVRGQMERARVAITAVHGTSRGQRRPPRRTGKSEARRAVRADAPPPTVIQRLRAGRRCTLVTINTTLDNVHALRAQLRAAGLTALGDPVGQRGSRTGPCPLSCLHLARLVVPHPTLGRKLTFTSAPPAAFAQLAQDDSDLERRLEAALARRLACLLDGSTDAYGLLLGRAEGVPGVQAERFGPVVLLTVLDGRRATPELLERAAHWYLRLPGVRGVYAKEASRQSTVREGAGVGRRGAEADQEGEFGPGGPALLAGREVEPRPVVRERGLWYQVAPGEGSVGLYLDQRENRARVRELAAGRSVLNLFAYTSGFSVAAAAGGAARVVSVDLSPKYLTWGRENFALNNLPITDEDFVRAEALDYLRTAQRRHEAFDLIVIDPPTFAHGRKGKTSFQVERDLPRVVADAVSVLAPDGLLLLCTNYRKLSRGFLEECARRAAGPRRPRVLERPALPPDYAADHDYAKSILLRFP